MNKKVSKILGVGLTIAMLATMLVMAAPVLATISAPTVTVAPTTISAVAQYTIKFDAYMPLAADTATITVVFPSGTTVPTADVAEAANANISVANDGEATSPGYTTANVTFTSASRTYVIKVPSAEATTGAATMAVKFATGEGIINPGTAGSYVISVKTSRETTAVDSTAYSITTPVKVDRYNRAGNFVGSYSGTTALADALTASADYDTLKLGAGTFEESPTITKNNVTIVALGTAAETIIGSSTTGVVTISGNYTTLDTLTIKGKVTVSAGVTNATIQNSILTKRSSTSTSATPLVTNSGTDLTVQNSTLDTTSGTVEDVGIDMAAAGATAKITSVTFKLDSDAGLVSDKAIKTSVALTTATNSLVVATSTFTGPYGIGYSDLVGSKGVVIKTSTFDQLEKAIDIDGAAAKATIQGNTITNSILVGTGTAAKGAITIDNNDVVTIESNTIKDNKGYSIKVTADADNVTVSGNSLSGNTMGLRSTDSANTLKAELNWWGATTGPTHATYNPSGTGDIVSDYVDAKPFLTADTSGANAARISTTTAGTASSLDASTTAGIAVEGVTTTAAAQIVASKLAANPKTVAPAYTPLAGAWFDLYISAASTTTITAKFYATGITSLTQAYFWSGLQGKWVAASEQGVSGAGDFVWVNIKAAGATSPTIPTTSDLTGTPFVLVSAPAAAVVVATVSLTGPAAAAVDVPISTGFSWAAVTGATYNFDLATNSAFTTPVASVTGLTSNVYGLASPLINSTTYFWRVQAVTTAGTSAWATATFVTVAKPVVAAPSLPQTITVEAPKVTVEAAKPAAVVIPFDIVSPALGATVSIEPVLTWTAFEGAISYEVMVATDKTFAIIDYSHNVAKGTTFYKSEPLSYGTTYYWRVRGVTGPAPAKAAAPGGAWANGIFTTEAKPVPAAKVEPQVIIQKEAAPPAQVIEVPVQTVVPQPIPSYLLWIIILVGAVLIIALIVLIARTRRVT